MPVNLSCIEALLSHEGLGTMGRTFAFTANTIEIDIVPDYMGNIDGYLFVRESCKAPPCRLD